MVKFIQLPGRVWKRLEALDGGGGDRVTLQMYDVVQSIAAQAPGKRPGVDGLAPEQLKALPMRAKLLLARLLAERFDPGAEGLRPEAWTHMLLTGIPKEKCLRELDKWRLISLTSVGQKISCGQCWA